MEIGMLWHDSDQRLDLKGKIRRAARHYTEKYGQEPDICFVHPRTLDRDAASSTRREGNRGPIKIDRISIERSEQVLPHHFWIGISGG